MTFTNLLVIKLRHIGDVLLATPVFRTLRLAYPEAKLTALLNRGTQEILRHNPDVNEILLVEKGSLAAQLRFLQDLRRKQYDGVVDLTDGDRSAFLSLATGARIRVGFNAEHRWRGLCYTHVAQPHPWDAHRIEYDLSALRPLGLTSAVASPILTYTPAEEAAAKRALADLVGPADASAVVVMQPGARYPLKVWPAERFAELADRLSAAVPCRILLGGDVREREVAEAVQARARCRPTVIAGRFSLREFGALLKHCSLFIGNDGGAMHLAAAAGTPVVAIFGPTYPHRWGPRGAPSEILYKGLDCRACYHPVCIRREEENCLRLITVDEVLERALRLLSRVRVSLPADRMLHDG